MFELLKVATENESIDKVVAAFFVEHDSPLFCEDGGAPLGLTQDLCFEQSVVQVKLNLNALYRVT